MLLPSHYIALNLYIYSIYVTYYCIYSGQNSFIGPTILEIAVNYWHRFTFTSILYIKFRSRTSSTRGRKAGTFLPF